MKEGKGGKKWQGKAMKGWIERRDGGGWKEERGRVERRGEQGGQEGWRRAVWKGKAGWKGRMEEVG